MWPPSVTEREGGWVGGGGARGDREREREREERERERERESYSRTLHTYPCSGHQSAGKSFWFNHITKESVWTAPQFWPGNSVAAYPLLRPSAANSRAPPSFPPSLPPALLPSSPPSSPPSRLLLINSCLKAYLELMRQSGAPSASSARWLNSDARVPCVCVCAIRF
jgi:hypothetical protein